MAELRLALSVEYIHPFSPGYHEYFNIPFFAILKEKERTNMYGNHYNLCIQCMH